MTLLTSPSTMARASVMADSSISQQDSWLVSYKRKKIRKDDGDTVVTDGVHSGVPSVQQALLAGLRDQGLNQIAADPGGEAAAYARQALDRLCTDIADPTVDQALLAECTDLFAALDGDAVRDRDRAQRDDQRYIAGRRGRAPAAA